MEVARSNAQLVAELLAVYQRGGDELLRELIRGAGSAAQVDTALGWHYGWTDGRVSRFHVYSSADEALDVAARLADG